MNPTNLSLILPLTVTYAQQKYSGIKLVISKGGQLHHNIFVTGGGGRWRDGGGDRRDDRGGFGGDRRDGGGGFGGGGGGGNSWRSGDAPRSEGTINFPCFPKKKG